MYYVYFLKSLSSTFRYTGYTSDLRKRIKKHNNGMSQATKHYIPYKLDAYIAVQTEKQAKDLEKYFKTARVLHLPEKEF